LAPVFWCLLLGARFLACSLPSYRRVLGGMFRGTGVVAMASCSAKMVAQSRRQGVPTGQN
jgi:hypothetical protein